ncbi:MarR family winged helix-turn-helix transcriptional regulator [Amycolatopsis ultiminotia]|uniref:MarR family winged helix-turn-helix transcriptional regulator n=1 Tax=Amycolatopsis ultiminotia TaxID=543629 RepID=A0ABP6W3A2_9PSEU
MTDSDLLDAGQQQLWNTWMRAHRLLVREVDRRLQAEFGISKAEFSVLVTLLHAPGQQLRVQELADSLGWEKSRVSHQLTRVENRGFVVRAEGGASGRRTGIGLARKGRRLAEQALHGHARAIRECFFDPLTPEQAGAILSWSEQLIDRVESPPAEQP